MMIGAKPSRDRLAVRSFRREHDAEPVIRDGTSAPVPRGFAVGRRRLALRRRGGEARGTGRLRFGLGRRLSACASTRRTTDSFGRHRRGDGWLPFSPTPANYASGLRAVREAAEGADRDPDSVATGAYLTVAVADSPQEAADQLEIYMQAYYGVPAAVMSRAQACHAGTVESASEWFAAYRSAGARHLVVRLARPGLTDYNDTARALLAAARGKVASR